MRTTVVIDDDVLDNVRGLSDRLHVSFKRVINDALRAGLNEIEKAKKQSAYRTTPRAMGLRKGYNLDNIQELLAQAEGEAFR